MESTAIPDYLLLYDSTLKVLLDRLERIRRTACSIIEAVARDRVQEEIAVAL